MVAAKFGDRVDPVASPKTGTTPLPTPSGLTQRSNSRPVGRAELPTATATPRVAGVVDRDRDSAASDGRATTSGPQYPPGPPPGFDNNFPPNFGFKDTGFDYNYGPPAPTAASNNQYQHYGGNSDASVPPPPPPAPSHYDQAPPAPSGPNYVSHGNYEEPAFMKSLLDQFDRVAAEERRNKQQGTSSSASPSSPQRLDRAPSRDSATSYGAPTPPTYRSTQAASSSTYNGPSATTVGHNTGVPNYGPSSSPSFGPTSASTMNYGHNVNHYPSGSTNGESNTNAPRQSAYYNQVPQPQGSATRYNNAGAGSFNHPAEPSYHGPPPPAPPPEPNHHQHGPPSHHHNTHGNNQQHGGNQHQPQTNHNQHDSRNSHNNHGDDGRYDSRHTWPQDLPDPSKDPRAQMTEERVGGENREGKPWGHKKKYVYKDPKNGKCYRVQLLYNRR